MAFDNRYKTGIDRSLWIWLVKNGYGHFLLKHELNSSIMSNKKLIIVREHFRFHPKYVLSFLHKQYPEAHIVYWLRNSLFLQNYNTGITKENINDFTELQKRLNFRIISFDKQDCQKYGLLYIPQNIDYPGIEEKVLLNDRNDIGYKPKWDIIWLGLDKGRIDLLKDLKLYFDTSNITYKMQVVADRRKIYSPEIKSILVYKNVPYERYLEDVLNSRAILDLCQKGQNGLTLRPIEAIRLRRKLITNYLAIDTYDFYRKENIFIIGKDNLSNIHEFLNTPYQELPDDIVNQYTFDGMIQRIYKEMNWDFSELK